MIKVSPFTSFVFLLKSHLSSPDGNIEYLSSTDHRGLKITTTRLSVKGTQRIQTRINLMEEAMVVISDLQGNKIKVTGNIQFDSKVENVWEVCSDCLFHTKHINISFRNCWSSFKS